MFIYPYKETSESAQGIRDHLGVPFTSEMGEPNGDEVILNWGCSQFPKWHIISQRWLNHPSAVHTTMDKVRTFKALRVAGIKTPAFTSNKDIAAEWVHQGDVVVSRKYVQSSKGRGIGLSKDMKFCEGFDEGKLYVRHMQHELLHEFRVNVVKDNTQLMQKRRKNGKVEEADPYIRDYGAWVWCLTRIKGVDEGSLVKVRKTAREAVKALGLDFGAVDLCLKNGEVYIIEVNTAPGISGSEIPFYCDNMLEVLDV